MVKKYVLKKVLNESKKKINEIYSMKNIVLDKCLFLLHNLFNHKQYIGDFIFTACCK